MLPASSAAALCPGDSKSRVAEIGRNHTALRALAGDGDRDGASSGAQVGNCLRIVWRDPAEGLFDQQLGFRSRHQGVDSDLQTERPELALCR